MSPNAQKPSMNALADGSWKRFLEVYEIGSVIGTGSSSVVCKVVKRSTRVEYAGKFTCQHEARKELNTLQQLRSDGRSERNFLSYQDAIEDETGRYTCLVSDLMRGSNLLTALRDRGSYSEEDARDIFRQILEGLRDMHESGMVHRDLKLENVLLPSAECHTSIKIADFGFAAPWSACDPKLKDRCGTPLFVAPEILPNDCEYDNKVDVWSAGVILHMILGGHPPFWGKNLADLLNSISKEKLHFTDPVWELVSAEAKDLIRTMMTKEHAARPSAEQALRHPWILRS